MKAPLIAFTIFLGVILTVHLSMNGMVGSAIRNPRMGNALFWCIGAVGGILIALTGWDLDALSGVKDVNPLLLTAGLMGASLVFAIAWLIPEVGAFGVMISLLAGQILGGLVLTHFGWLGSAQKPISVMNMVGAAVMIAGVILANRQ